MYLFTVLLPFFFYANANSKVYFIQPKNGASVHENFIVKMGLDSAFKLCEAGKDTTDKSCGHHHIIIDGGMVAEGQPIPNDKTHLHYGKKQTEANVNLSKGKHMLTLQFADFAHRSFGADFSQTIEVTVE